MGISGKLVYSTILYHTFSSQRNPKGLFGESRICEGKGDPFDKLRTGFRVCVYGREFY
jgi:hypothetical protein